MVCNYREKGLLPGDSYSALDIQEFIEYIVKKHETLPTNSATHIYIKRINRIVLKMKDGYNYKHKLHELQTLEMMKLFYSTKKLIMFEESGRVFDHDLKF